MTNAFVIHASFSAWGVSSVDRAVFDMIRDP
jgi:hypothetical protein